MSSSSNKQAARERILARLYASGTHQTEVPDSPLPPALSLDRNARVERLAELMTAIRTEVHIVEADGWLDAFKELARKRGWKRLLYGPQGPIGPAIERSWSVDSDNLPDLVAYDT